MGCKTIKKCYKTLKTINTLSQSCSFVFMGSTEPHFFSGFLPSHFSHSFYHNAGMYLYSYRWFCLWRNQTRWWQQRQMDSPLGEKSCLFLCLGLQSLSVMRRHVNWYLLSSASCEALSTFIPHLLYARLGGSHWNTTHVFLGHTVIMKEWNGVTESKQIGAISSL